MGPVIGWATAPSHDAEGADDRFTSRHTWRTEKRSLKNNVEDNSSISTTCKPNKLIILVLKPNCVLRGACWIEKPQVRVHI